MRLPSRGLLHIVKHPYLERTRQPLAELAQAAHQLAADRQVVDEPDLGSTLFCRGSVTTRLVDQLLLLQPCASFVLDYDAKESMGFFHDIATYEADQRPCLWQTGPPLEQLEGWPSVAMNGSKTL